MAQEACHSTCLRSHLWCHSCIICVKHGLVSLMATGFSNLLPSTSQGPPDPTLVLQSTQAVRSVTVSKAGNPQTHNTSA